MLVNSLITSAPQELEGHTAQTLLRQSSLWPQEDHSLAVLSWEADLAPHNQDMALSVGHPLRNQLYIRALFPGRYNIRKPLA